MQGSMDKPKYKSGDVMLARVSRDKYRQCRIDSYNGYYNKGKCHGYYVSWLDDVAPMADGYQASRGGWMPEHYLKFEIKENGHD